MNKVITPARALMFILAIVALPAAASSLGLGYILRDTPMSYFDDADMSLFETTLTQTLSEAKDNEMRAWSNPKTKSRGEITALRTHEWENGVCRQVSIINTAKGQTGKGVYTFCRQKQGAWKIRMPHKK